MEGNYQKTPGPSSKTREERMDSSYPNSVEMGAANDFKVTEPEEISIRELFLKFRNGYIYLRSKWLFIVIGGVIGGTIGLGYAKFKKPIYKGELTFALEDDQSGGGGLGGALGLASQFGFDLGGSGGGAFSGDNLLELMKSRTMVQKTLLTEVEFNGKRETLAELYIHFNGLRDNWKNKPELHSVHFSPGLDAKELTRIQDSVIGKFHKSIIADNLIVNKPDKKLSIIAVKVNSENELFSKYFTEVLAKNVSDFYVDTKTKKSTDNLAILQHQTDSVKNVLNSAISGVAISSDLNPNPNPARQVLRVPSQRRQVDVQANQAILMELVKNLEISKVSLRKETPLIQIIDSPILPLEKEKVSKIKSMLIGLIIGSFLSAFLLLFKKFFSYIKNLE